MCLCSHETRAYAKSIEEEEEHKFFKTECQSGAGTARYVSASWNSAGSSEVGDDAESESESESVVVLLLSERKLKRGVKS